MAVDYKGVVRNMGYNKRLGQNFLLNPQIAQSEAEYGRDRNVLEVGPGLGILTSRLVKLAKSVTAVEKDTKMFEFLQANIKSKKLRLINKDFLDVEDKELGDIDIMISNIPYNLSSKIIMWLSERNVPALLCMQKEFVDRMLAEPGSTEYSKLSVVSALQFKLTRMFDVTPNNFYPEPEVTSTVVYIKPIGGKVSREAREIIGAIMSHKKKRIKNALMDSAKQLGIDKKAAADVAKEFDDSEARPFQMQPSSILAIADKLRSSQK